MKYFTVFTAVRQANPTDDLASLIANGVIDGEPLSTMDRLSYYLIIATAGHDTTSYALAEAMGALLEHPEQEMRSLFRHLVPRLRSVELAGVPAHSKTTTVGGIKRLPIRYEITPAASASQEIR